MSDRIFSVPRVAVAGSAIFVAAMLLAGASQAQESLAPRLDTAYPNYQPPYPDTAQVNGEQGVVVLNVQVAASGRVRNVQIVQSSGFADLDNAAIEGVMSWHYKPAIIDGDTTTSWTKVTINYRLPTAPAQPNKT